jgi:hypothetical protein
MEDENDLSTRSCVAGHSVVHDQAVTVKRVRYPDSPWLLRNVVLVLGIPLLSAAVVLPLADASDNWWLLAGVLMVLYVIAVFAAILVVSLRGTGGKKINRKDLPD